MKRSIIITAALLFCISVAAQTVERVYVSTDRNAYIAGDRVWCSLFSFNADGALSDGSAVSYLELISADGTAVEAKIGLREGRGAGSFTLPASIPSGNYRLVAYTSTGNVSEAGSRLISVYNPYFTKRVCDGVELCSSWNAVFPDESATGGLEVRVGDSGEITLKAAEWMTLSVSICRSDSLQQLPLPFIGDFLSADEPMIGGAIEFDGEVIRARAIGSREGTMAFLSSAGSPSDTYIAVVGADGSLSFPTCNIYGNRELVCEVMDGSETTYISMESPFLHPEAGIIPPLQLSPAMERALMDRVEVLRSPLRVDTLATFIPRREDPLFDGLEWTVYNLDDYVRFPSTREVIQEIVTEARIGTVHGKRAFRLIGQDGVNSRKYFKDNILTMMDGVIISDVNLILGFDAMLFDRVELCTQNIVIGRTPFEGIINFVTKNLYVRNLSFPSRVRVVDFLGVSYPVVYLGDIPSSVPCRRDLLYWNPLMEMEEGESVTLPVSVPSGPGTWRIVVEGVSEGGLPVGFIVPFVDDAKNY